MNIVLTSLAILLIVILFFTMIYLITNNYEKYVNNSIMVIDNSMNVKNSYNVSSAKLVEIIDDIKKTNTINSEIVGVENQDIVLYIDPYINKYIFKNNQNTDKYKDGIFVCLSPLKLKENDCIWDFRDKVIGYVYLSDYLFIQAMIKGYRQDVKDVILKKILPEDLKKGDKQFDYLFTYIVINSDYMNYIKQLKYYINGLKDVDINRIKAFYPFISEKYNTTNFYFSRNEDNNMYDMYLNNDLTLLPIMKYDILRTVENFITRLDIANDYYDKDADSNEVNGYGCFGDSYVKNKFECNSIYKINGLPKKYYSVWDNKCRTNDECPYYKKNTKYANIRGGCISGYCELPVGVKRIAFKKYKDENFNSPLCYDCEDATDLDCCSTPTNFENNKPLKNDYVFENDFSERENNNLNTIISLLDYRRL